MFESMTETIKETIIHLFGSHSNAKIPVKIVYGFFALNINLSDIVQSWEDFTGQEQMSKFKGRINTPEVKKIINEQVGDIFSYFSSNGITYNTDVILDNFVDKELNGFFSIEVRLKLDKTTCLNINELFNLISVEFDFGGDEILDIGDISILN